jgi:hypothetical protein
MKWPDNHFTAWIRFTFFVTIPIFIVVFLLGELIGLIRGI